MAKRNIDPIKISTFQSKRKGTVSAKILIPSNCREQVLSKHFWPKSIHCKLWQQGERNRDSIRRKERARLPQAKPIQHMYNGNTNGYTCSNFISKV